MSSTLPSPDRVPEPGASRRATSLLRILGPGLLVAATGVGAGDLATAAFAGSALGLGVLWAVLAGAGVKLLLNEGLTRWQLATGTTLLEGAMGRLGRPARLVFLGYFLLWSFLVAAALMSACGAAAHALLPLLATARADKIAYGLVHSAAGLLLVRLGGYRVFQRVMGAAVAVMFVTVVTTAVRVVPDWTAVAAGALVPSIPAAGGAGLGWTVALMGGVGGTLTVLCYGYWIREEGRTGPEALGTCRLDLAVGYAATALFGLSMVVLGSTVEVSGRGVGLIVALADSLGGTLGPVGRGLFLVGAWAAVASSLLGVWQSVPYLFADLWRLLAPGDRSRPSADTASRPYRLYLYGLATVPAVGLLVGFAAMQKVYAIAGAAFMPMLAAALLWLNGPRGAVGPAHRNRPASDLLLGAVLLFFALAFVLVVL